MTDVDAFVRKLDKELRTGLLSLLVLRVLNEDRSERYGYEVIQRLKELSDNGLVVPEGTIYPILHGLQDQGLVRARWGESANGPPRKYYRLTEDGHRGLAQGLRLWRSCVEAAESVVRGTGGK